MHVSGIMEPTTFLEPAAAAVRSGAGLRDWLCDAALPTWSTVGVDRRQGGYAEAIDLHGRAVEAPRRTRVAARQVYVFATAARHGWMAGADALVEHGLAYLHARLRLPDGSYATSVSADGTFVDPAFDLYEQAFALFAFAAAARDRPARAAVMQREAEAVLSLLRSRWAHPEAGFEEASPRSLPLRSNPHMHLLEAALEWEDLAPGAGSPWALLADELVALCCRRFVDPSSGAVRENFDGEWRPMPGAAGRLVEPGHQFEWAWLLMRWAARRERPEAVLTALRLLEIGETHGVDASRGVAVNALDDALRVTDPNAKLWPQTERIKAWHFAHASATSAAARERAGAALQAAIGGFTRYLLPNPPGLWHEVMNLRGGFTEQHCRASSLYHIVCAIETLQQPDRVIDDRMTPA